MLSIGLILGLLAQDPSPAETYGRDMLTVGVCASLGWVADTADADEIGQTLAAANPGMTKAQFDAAAARAGTQAGEEIRTDLAAVADQAAFQAWATTMAARCDGLAVTYPTVLRRGSDTEAAWAGTKARLSARYPG